MISQVNQLTQLVQQCLRVCVYLAIGSVVQLMIQGCEKRQTPVKVDVVITPNYLEIYDLIQHKDETHSIEMIGPDGKTWYRGSKPIIDLSMIEIDKTYVSRYTYQGGGYGVIICIRPQFNARLSEWSETHMGDYAGVAIQGKLVNVDRIVSPIVSRGLIKFPSEKEASAVAAAIKSGGLCSEYLHQQNASQSADTLPAL